MSQEKASASASGTQQPVQTPVVQNQKEFRKAVTPQNFQPQETSQDNWLKQFACWATANNWSEQTKIVMLSTKLVGNALEEYERFELDENKDISFDDLVKGIGKEVRCLKKIALQTYLSKHHIREFFSQTFLQQIVGSIKISISRGRRFT